LYIECRNCSLEERLGVKRGAIKWSENNFLMTFGMKKV